MNPTLTLLLACLLGAALWLIDRGLLKAEERGWIYYRKKRGYPGRMGKAFSELQAMLEPGRRHVIEEQRREDSEKPGEGAPPI